jgi:hypothetical protein
MTTPRTFVGTIKDGVVTVELDRRPDVVGRLSEPPGPSRPVETRANQR